MQRLALDQEELHRNQKKGGANLDHIRGDIADAASPAIRGPIQDIVHAKEGVLSCEGIKVLAQKNILRRDICKDEIDLGLVSGWAGANDGANDLQHRGDAGAAGDHADAAGQAGVVDKGAARAAHANGLADR